MTRSPPLRRTVTAPSRHRNSAGSSEAGSAWTRFPTTVPRFLIGSCATDASTSATRRGARPRPALEIALPGERADGERAPTLRKLVEIIAAVDVDERRGRARRRASMGMRLWPPASTLASVTVSAERIDGLGRARWGHILEWRGLHVLLAASMRTEDHGWSRGRASHADIEGGQRVLDRIGDGGGRRDGPALADALDSQRVARRRVLEMHGLDGGSSIAVGTR